MIKSFSVFSNNEIDTEEFQLGFELTLPQEMQDFLSGKMKPSQKSISKGYYENKERLLDEHELALG